MRCGGAVCSLGARRWPGDAASRRGCQAVSGTPGTVAGADHEDAGCARDEKRDSATGYEHVAFHEPERLGQHPQLTGDAFLGGADPPACVEQARERSERLGCQADSFGLRHIGERPGQLIRELPGSGVCRARARSRPQPLRCRSQAGVPPMRPACGERPDDDARKDQHHADAEEHFDGRGGTCDFGGVEQGLNSSDAARTQVHSIDPAYSCNARLIPSIRATVLVPGAGPTSRKAHFGVGTNTDAKLLRSRRNALAIATRGAATRKALSRASDALPASLRQPSRVSHRCDRGHDRNRLREGLKAAASDTPNRLNPHLRCRRMTIGDRSALPTPTPIWEKRLISAAKRGDRGAEVRLLEIYEPMVRRIASTLHLPGGEREDLAQEARLGVLDAIRAWDPERRVPFKSFAWLCAGREARLAVDTARAGKH